MAWSGGVYDLPPQHYLDQEPTLFLQMQIISQDLSSFRKAVWRIEVKAHLGERSKSEGSLSASHANARQFREDAKKFGPHRGVGGVSCANTCSFDHLSCVHASFADISPNAPRMQYEFPMPRG